MVASDESAPRARASLAVQCLLFLAVCYTLYFAAEFFIPVTAAFILSLLLTPLVRLLGRLGLGPAVAAALIVAGFVIFLAGGFYALSGPVTDWAERMPQIAEEVRAKLRTLREPVERVQEVSKQVEEATKSDSRNADEPAKVVLQTPGLLDRLFSSLQQVGIQLTATVVLLYFMLSVGDLFTEKLVRAMPRFSDKKKALTIVRQVEQDVSRYLGTVTLINIGFGACVGGGLFLIGMPNAVLWGAVATFLNFIPYFGAIAGMGLVGLVALLAFPTVGQAALAPAVYFVCNLIESQFVTPLILSRRLTINPVVLFLAVAFWGFIWGVPGALMAVPLLVAMKVLCDHVERLNAIGEFLGGRETSES